MLVLSRQRDQVIYIGGGIKITVVDIRGDQVRLGIEAPAGVSILRDNAKRVCSRPGRTPRKT